MSAIMRESASEYQARIDAQAIEDEWVEKRGKDLHAQYLNDLEYIGEALSDLAYYKVKSSHIDPKTLPILRLVRDGSDHTELGRLICEAVKEWLGQKATDDAELEYEPRGRLSDVHL